MHRSQSSLRIPRLIPYFICINILHYRPSNPPPRPPEVRQRLLDTLLEAVRRMGGPARVPRLDPLSDMNVQDPLVRELALRGKELAGKVRPEGLGCLLFFVFEVLQRLRGMGALLFFLLRNGVLHGCSAF